MRLSPHLTFDEATASGTAKRLKITNIPSSWEHDNLIRTAVQFELVRITLGNKPIPAKSMYRSPAVNVAVGGSTDEICWIAAMKQLGCKDASEMLSRYGIKKPKKWKAASYHLFGCALDFDPPKGINHNDAQHLIGNNLNIDFDLILEEKALDGSHWLHFQIPLPGNKGRRLIRDATLARQGGAITRITAG